MNDDRIETASEPQGPDEASSVGRKTRRSRRKGSVGSLNANVPRPRSAKGRVLRLITTMSRTLGYVYGSDYCLAQICGHRPGTVARLLRDLEASDQIRIEQEDGGRHIYPVAAVGSSSAGSMASGK
jgi:CRP-like cAMP-binding protein